MGVRAASLIWGLAEAMLFFIVPDVLLSAVALQDRALALRCCLWALGGALLGGIALFAASSVAPEAVTGLLLNVPAVSEDMLGRVMADLVDIGPWALFLGPLTGTPYKLYAASAPQIGLGLGLFLLVSVPARLVRFVLVVLIADAVSRWLLARWTLTVRRVILGVFWTVFYAGFFAMMS